MEESFGGSGRPIDFEKYIGGEESLAKATRDLRTLQKTLTTFGKTAADDSGKIKAGLDIISAAISGIQSKAVKLSLITPEDKKLLNDYIKQVADLKAVQDAYKGAQQAQQLITQQAQKLQRDSAAAAKEFTSELAKQKDALRAAATANDIEEQKKAAAAIRATAAETKDLNAALRGSNSALTAATGSYDELVVRNNKLLASLHGLEGGLQAGSQEAQKLKQQIYDNTETLKLFDAETNRSFRNVGNYASSFSGLIAELAKARTAQAGLAAGSEEYNRAQIKIAGFQTAAQRSAAQMGLSFEQANASIEGVTAAVQPLTTALVRLEKEQEQVAVSAGKESEAYRKIGFEIQSTKTKIEQVAEATAKAGDAQTTLGQQLGFTKEGLSQYITQLAVGAVGLQAIASAAVSVFQANVEYSRNLAEVRKTTGLTADEAERLAQSLKQLDSPTNLTGLLKIASVGGQLGIAKDDLLEFTKSIDTAVQALGNDFSGGAEEIATVLGKISTVYRKELGADIPASILAVGSAVNELGAVGAATSPFLTDVALRVGAVASQSGIGLKNVLAYAAVLQETGTTAEVAGSSLNRLFSTLSTKTEESFKIAQRANPALTLKEFTRLVNTDFNQAIQVFLKGLNAGNISTTEQARLLGTLKLQSGEAKSAIVTLAANTDLFAQRQATANDQLRDATSLSKEAAVNSDTLGSSVDKLTNEVKNFTTTGAAGNFLKFFVDLARQIGPATASLTAFVATAGAFGSGPILDKIRDKLGLNKKVVDDLAAAQASAVQASYKQISSQEGLLKSYTELGAVVGKTGLQENEYSKLRERVQKEFGTTEAKAIAESIARRREETEANKGELQRNLDQYTAAVEEAARRAAKLRDAFAQAPKEADGRPNTRAGQQAAEALAGAEADLAEKQRVRAQYAAALAKFQDAANKATGDGVTPTIEAAKAEERLGRTQIENAKNRLQDLKDSLTDNQLAIDKARKYQAEQAKLFDDEQITTDILKERVAGSQDYITQKERDGTALRIKIAKAESVEKLAEANKDRLGQLARKELSEAEKTDIEGQYSRKRVGIVKAEKREIAKIEREAGERQGAVEQAEFKPVEIDYDAILRARSKVRLRSYQDELTDIKEFERNADDLLTGQLARREITQGQYDERQRINRKNANDRVLALDEKFHKDSRDDQRKADEDKLDDARNAANKRLKLTQYIEEQIGNAGSIYFQARQQQLDTEAANHEAAKEKELATAGENEELKAQINDKYTKLETERKRKQADLDKKSALFQIALNTAMAVTSVLSTGGGTRYADFGISAAVLSGIVIANGIAQAALVLAKPTPYFKGRKGGPKELAEVGERGPELIERMDKNGGSRFEYAAARTVTILNEGDSVYSAPLTTSMLASVGMNHSQAQQPGQVAQAFNGAAQGAAVARETASQGNSRELLAAMQKNTATLQKLNQVTVTVHKGSDASVQTTNQLTHYLSQATFGRLG